MKSIKADFRKIGQNQFLSSHTILAEAIKGKQYSRETIVKNFNNLVDKDEYSDRDKKALIDYLYFLSNPLRSSK